MSLCPRDTRTDPSEIFWFIDALVSARHEADPIELVQLVDVCWRDTTTDPSELIWLVDVLVSARHKDQLLKGLVFAFHALRGSQTKSASSARLRFSRQVGN